MPAIGNDATVFSFMKTPAPATGDSLIINSMTARSGFISPRGWSKLRIGKEDRMGTGSGFQASLAVIGESNLTKPRWQQCLGGWSKLAS